MNPIASYIRHLIVTGIVLLLAKFKLPIEGADAFADAVSLFAIATASWALVKYAPDLARKLGMMCLALCACCLFLPACSTTVTTTTLPDGTRIEVNAKSADKDAINAAIGVSTLLLPYVIHPDK